MVSRLSERNDDVGVTLSVWRFHRLELIDGRFQSRSSLMSAALWSTWYPALTANPESHYLILVVQAVESVGESFRKEV